MGEERQGWPARTLKPSFRGEEGGGDGVARSGWILEIELTWFADRWDARSEQERKSQGWQLNVWLEELEAGVAIH